MTMNYAEERKLFDKLRELEARLDRAERMAAEARDECFRLEARLSTLEYER
jgi:BMFP domain-containing protein YqiC